MPTGSYLWHAGSTAPTGYLSCAGGAISRTDYADLFAVIGTTYGVGDGSTTFNLPNQARRALVGAGGTSTGTLGNAVGSTGGAETHTLTTAQLASHTHTYVRRGFGTIGVVAGATGVNQILGTNTLDSGASGSGSAHNNMQPSLVGLLCIKT
jgi:microcystin-dependent protein